MVTTLLQIHHDIQKGNLITSLDVQGTEVSGQDVFVIFPEVQKVSGLSKCHTKSIIIPKQGTLKINIATPQFWMLDQVWMNQPFNCRHDSLKFCKINACQY